MCGGLVVTVGGERADRSRVSALEPISPELVLVCPELRAWALAELPDPEFVAMVAQVRQRARVATEGAQSAPWWRVLARGAASPLVAPLLVSGGVVVVTAVLTFVADAVR